MLNEFMNDTTPVNRRHFLQRQSFGLGSLALAYLMQREAAAAPPKPELERLTFDLKPRRPALQPQATAMISLFMQGGPSHLDLFDPKPELTRRHLQETTEKFKLDNTAQASKKLWASPFKFSRRGVCGMELSELLPNLGRVADDICLIRSMHTGNSGHETNIAALNTGRFQRRRPALGSWISYALGTENQNLPAFVVLTDPTGLPVLGVENWDNAWLPSLYQGAVIRSREPRILNLDPPSALRGAPQERILSYLRDINQEHLARHPGENELEARIQNYELAARMQVAAKEAMDISRETAETRALYGIDKSETRDYGTRCLIARRLVERGVRFVQVHTGNQTWDHHGAIQTKLPAACRKTDKGAAALIQDLKRIGLLDTTLVHWGGEMGRLPVIQNEKSIGRDHNGEGFSMWLAGGGVRGGQILGETDEIGHKAATDIVNHFDYHATLLHLFGLDPTQASITRTQGSASLLDSQPGQVISKILHHPPATI
jgi:hypothetical protein